MSQSNAESSAAGNPAGLGADSTDATGSTGTARAASAPDADQRRTKMSWAMLGAGVAILLGAFLPWATAAGEETLGGFSWGPGKVTAVVGILLGLYGAQGLRKDDPRVRYHGWAIAAIVVGLLVATSAWQLLDTIDSFTLGVGDVGMGLGLVITLLALCFSIWPLVVLRRDDRERHGVARARAVGGGAAPGWHVDPTGRFDRRYFDGEAWTEHVARGSEQSTDPVVQQEGASA